MHDRSKYGLQKFEEVEDYGRCNREWLAANFGILPKGSPSDSTIHRMMKGTLFTGDAMGCQTAIVKRIRDGEGHYLLGVKDNQRSLADDIELTCRLKHPDETSQTTDAGHGKVVRRTCCTYTDLSLIERLPDWKGLRTVVRIESRTRIVKTNEVTSETRYYISDIKNSAEFFNQEVRRHWMIENYLHWNLDNAFRQDRCVRLSTSASRNLDNTYPNLHYSYCSVTKELNDSSSS